jgi:two-component system, OmpR family, sensor histidine kinase KdpD
VKRLPIERVAAALALVGLVTGIGLAVSADLTEASLLLLVAVLLASLLGPWAGAAAAGGGFVALVFCFTHPSGNFAIENDDDLVALAAFLVTAALIGWVVTRLDALRQTAEQRAREAQIRLDLTNRLGGGDDPTTVAASTADAIVALFGLTSCTVRLGSNSAMSLSTGAAPGDQPIIVQVGEVVVDGSGPPHALSPSDRAVLEALVAALAATYDRQRLEAEAREARVAVQISQTRSGFLSAVSHNLRTPLASIRAAASTLRSPDAHLAPEDRHEMLDTLIDETERLERLVTKTLDLSRIRAGGVEPELRVAEIGDLATAAVRRLRPLAHDHTIRLAVDAELPAVCVDVGMIEEVFLDLLENALRFAPSGSEICVGAERVGDFIEVRVADHGPGVPPDQRARIFEEFARVDARPDATGTGLGLAIVRALITAHGGHVWCEETAGGGATFGFAVPVVDTQ